MMEKHRNLIDVIEITVITKENEPRGGRKLSVIVISILCHNRQSLLSKFVLLTLRKIILSQILETVYRLLLFFRYFLMGIITASSRS